MGISYKSSTPKVSVENNTIDDSYKIVVPLELSCDDLYTLEKIADKSNLTVEQVLQGMVSRLRNNKEG